MGLSMVSLTYGIFITTSNHTEFPVIRKSHKATQFLATGVDMLWFLGVFFTAGQMSTTVTALLVGLGSTVGIVSGCAFTAQDAMRHTSTRLVSAVFFLCVAPLRSVYQFLISFVFVSMTGVPDYIDRCSRLH